MGEFGGSQNNLVGAKPAHASQYLVAMAATLGSLAMGAILGYSSPASPDLQWNNTTNESCGGELSHTLSSNEISWFGSTVNIGALIGAPLSGYLIKTIGRRITMVSISGPFLLGWLLIGKYFLLIINKNFLFILYWY